MTPPSTEIKLLPESMDLYYAAKIMMRYKNNLHSNQWLNLENAVNRFDAAKQRHELNTPPQPTQDAIKAASEEIASLTYFEKSPPWIACVKWIEQILTKHLNPKTR